MPKIELMQGDCLEKMKDIPDGSIDCVIPDPPYGTTACKWDTCIPFEPMWEQLKRITKKNGAIVLFGSQPFTSALVMSNPKMFKYEWVWDKISKTDVFNAKNKPLKQHENILVFSSGTTANKSDRKMIYLPQGVLPGKRFNPKNRKAAGYMGSARPSHKDYYVYQGSNYPSSIIELSNANRTNIIHPTQKPVALMEYLIKTYTNEGETVLGVGFDKIFH